MKNLNAGAFARSNKKNKTLLIVGIILLGITILLIYLGIENEKKPLPTPINISDLIVNKQFDEDVYSYLDIVTKPYLFAVYETDGIEDNSKYYLVMDKENHLYTIYMNETKYQELNVDSIEYSPIRVHGITKKIPTDIKNLAIESYNELIEEEILTDDNFQDYVGLIYLDLEEKINDSELYYLGACLSGIFFIIVIVIYIVIIIMNKKIFKKIRPDELANIDAELSMMNTSEYANMKFYLLKEYVVDLTNNVVILKYSDIIWAYPYEQRYNGLLINKCIKVIDKNNKRHDIANTKFLDKNKDEILNNILNNLKEKNPDIIIGFTNENKKIVKEKLKELKKK